MKRFYILLILIISTLNLHATDINSQELILETIVPENYGIYVPDEAISLDQFLFEFSTEAGTSELLTDSHFSIGSFEDVSMQSFTLLYYGNLSSDYNVIVKAGTRNGFVNNNAGDAISIPVDINYSEPENKPEDIKIIDDEEYGICSILIPPAGPRRGVEVVDLNISWGSQRDVIPGNYELALNIELLSNT